MDEGLSVNERVEAADDAADVKAHLVGDAAVLTFNFTSYGGSEDAFRWNCTEVYRRAGRSWQIIQTHWSFTRGERPTTSG